MMFDRLHIIREQNRGIADCINASLQMMNPADHYEFNTFKSTIRSLCKLLPAGYYKIHQVGWKKPIPEGVHEVISLIEDEIAGAFDPMLEKEFYLPILSPFKTEDGKLNDVIGGLQRKARIHLEKAYENGHWDGKADKHLDVVLRLDPREVKRQR